MHEIHPVFWFALHVKVTIASACSVGTSFLQITAAPLAQFD